MYIRCHPSPFQNHYGKKGVQREHLAHHLCNRCSVLHHNTADGQNRSFVRPLVGVFRSVGRGKYLQAFCGVAVFSCADFRFIQFKKEMMAYAIRILTIRKKEDGRHCRVTVILEMVDSGHISLDMDTIFAIMTEEKPNQKEQIKLKKDNIKGFFPKDYTSKQMEQVIMKLLADWQRKRERNRNDAR